MKLELRNVGQLREATVEFGDLTVLVGPQASGKSIFLQFLKLCIDARRIVFDLRRSGKEWQDDLRLFLEMYLGEGMSGLWRSGEGASQVLFEGNQIDLGSIVQSATSREEPSEALFYIPAQRVLALNQEGWWRHFSDYHVNDPFVARAFSENMRQLMDSERLVKPAGGLFPRGQHLRTEVRSEVNKAIFHGFELVMDNVSGQNRLALKSNGARLPFMVWSAGQREFVPLLLGLYWLMPAGGVARRHGVSWAVVEEIEMGLHPRAVSAVMLAVLDLIARGYRVVLSTHSPHVLDVVWGIRTIQQRSGSADDLIDMFGVQRTAPTLRVFRTVLQKSYRTFYFNPGPAQSRQPSVTDISTLDPGSDSEATAGWGGLTEFSGRIADVVTRVVARSEQGQQS
jgi:hypothetical protein